MRVISILVVLQRQRGNYFSQLPSDAMNYLLALLFTGTMGLRRRIGKSRDQLICGGEIGLVRWNPSVVEHVSAFGKTHMPWREQFYKHDLSRIRDCLVSDGYILITRVEQRGILAIRLDVRKESIIPTLHKPTFVVHEGNIYVCHQEKQGAALVTLIAIKQRTNSVVLTGLSKDSRILDATSKGLIVYEREEINHYDYTGKLLLSYPLQPADFPADDTVNMVINRAGLLAISYDDTIDIFSSNGVRLHQYRDRRLRSPRLVAHGGTFLFFDRRAGEVRMLQ